MRSLQLLTVAFGLGAALADNKRGYFKYRRQELSTGESALPTEAVPSSSALFANTSSLAPTFIDPTDTALPTDLPTATATVPMTTSTVSTTRVLTLTQCPPDVVDCPAGGLVTTETVALYTTVCPVDGHWVAPPAHTTKTYVVTKCADHVVDCPYGQVTTEVRPGPTASVFVPGPAPEPCTGEDCHPGQDGEVPPPPPGCNGDDCAVPPAHTKVVPPGPSGTGPSAPPVMTAGASALVVGVMAPVALFGAQVLGL